MKGTLIAVAAALLLSACAGQRHYPVEQAGGGRYYIAETPASIVHYSAAEGYLLGYGLSPWWGYGYYSPYFYPHYFSVSYSPWPYYAPWPYHSYWYADRPFGFTPYWRHYHRYPGHRPGNDVISAPSPGYSGPPAGLPVRTGERLRVMDDRSLQRELRRGETSAGQPPGSRAASRTMPPASSPAARHRGPGSRGTAGVGSSATPSTPSMPAAAGRSMSPSGAGSGPVSRRNPRKHDQ